MLYFKRMPHYPIAELKEDAEVKEYLDKGYRITSVGGLMGQVTVCLVKED